MTRHKGFIFHPEDWLSDARLAMCSYATKGVWMDLLCYMYQSKRGGYLMIDGKALSKSDVEKMLKCRSSEEFESIWNELLTHGVMKQHADGTYYSKRMVEDVERFSLSATASSEEVQLAQQVLDEFSRVVNSAKAYHVERAKVLIISLIRSGVTLNDFKAVIRAKYEEWKDSDKMRPWLRPATLFGEKFPEYLAETKSVAPTMASGKTTVGKFDYDDL